MDTSHRPSYKAAVVSFHYQMQKTIYDIHCILTSSHLQGGFSLLLYSAAFFFSICEVKSNSCTIAVRTPWKWLQVISVCDERRRKGHCVKCRPTIFIFCSPQYTYMQDKMTIKIYYFLEVWNLLNTRLVCQPLRLLMNVSSASLLYWEKEVTMCNISDSYIHHH
jgi:hypothetical protein